MSYFWATVWVLRPSSSSLSLLEGGQESPKGFVEPSALSWLSASELKFLALE